MGIQRSSRMQYLEALGISTLVSVGLFAYGAYRNDSLVYGFMCWNIVLAWIPLLFALRLNVVLKTKLWSSWEALATSVLWFVFLPNSFYMITDYIHIADIGRADIIYDTVMFTSFVFTALMLGFTSLYLVHLQLRRRLTPNAAAFWIGITLLICSGAIYIGRDLRWNSWDILVNPGGLLFDVSDRLQHPSTYPQMLLTVFAFFVLLAGLYNLVWRASRALQTSRQ